MVETVIKWAKSNEWLRKYDMTILEQFQNRYHGYYDHGNPMGQTGPQRTDLVREFEKYLGLSGNGGTDDKRLPRLGIEECTY